MEKKDKRNKQPAIPKNVQDYLNLDQEMALVNLRQFGWEIKFIRRPPFQDSIVVLINTDGRTIGVLEKDGRINTDPKMVIRD